MGTNGAALFSIASVSLGVYSDLRDHHIPEVTPALIWYYKLSVKNQGTWRKSWGIFFMIAVFPLRHSFSARKPFISDCSLWLGRQNHIVCCVPISILFYKLLLLMKLFLSGIDPITDALTSCCKMFWYDCLFDITFRGEKQLWCWYCMWRHF